MKIHLRALLFLFFVSLSVSSGAANLYSRADGSWSAVGTWSYTPGGPSCGCTPLASDNVTIDHRILMDKHLTNIGSNTNGITGILRINASGWLDGGGTYDIDIRSTGVLHLCGILTARDVIFSNGSQVYVCPGGQLTVNGDFQNKNNSNNIIIDGNFTVNGSFTNGNGGVIGGSGVVTITNGPVTNTGNTLGCIGYNPCTSYPCGIVAPCATPLPIELLSFTATYQSPNVHLKWITETEINNDFFTIERSDNAVDFRNLMMVDGAGNSTQRLYYSAIDAQPLKGISYYRLKQTDYDGRFSYSETVAVRIKSTNAFSVYPSLLAPNQQGLIISIPENEDAVIRIFDPAGKKVMESFLNGQGEMNQNGNYFVDLPFLATGVYVVAYQSASNSLATRVLVFGN